MTMMFFDENGDFFQQQQQQQPNFAENNIRPEVSNFPLPNLNQQNIEPSNVPNKNVNDLIL